MQYGDKKTHPILRPAARRFRCCFQRSRQFCYAACAYSAHTSRRAPSENRRRLERQLKRRAVRLTSSGSLSSFRKNQSKTPKKMKPNKQSILACRSQFENLKRRIDRLKWVTEKRVSRIEAKTNLNDCELRETPLYSSKHLAECCSWRTWRQQRPWNKANAQSDLPESKAQRLSFWMQSLVTHLWWTDNGGSNCSSIKTTLDCDRRTDTSKCKVPSKLPENAVYL